MSFASSRLPTIRSDTLKRTRWYRSINRPNAPPSPSRHRSSRASSCSSTPSTGESGESWRGGVMEGALVKAEDPVQAGVDENRPDPGFHVDEPEIQPRVAEPLERLDEDAQARARDVVQDREIEGGGLL